MFQLFSFFIKKNPKRTELNGKADLLPSPWHRICHATSKNSWSVYLFWVTGQVLDQINSQATIIVDRSGHTFLLLATIIF